MPKKILTWGAIAFLLFFVAFRPESAAQVFKQLGNGVANIAQGLGEFFTNLVA